MLFQGKFYILPELFPGPDVRFMECEGNILSMSINRKFFRSLSLGFLITVTIFMTSCTTTKDFTSGGGEHAPYLAALQKEYRKLATRQRKEFDLKDNMHFSAKAAAAAKGEFVQPDHPRNRDMATDNYPKVWSAHERLTRLPIEVYTAFPRDAAAAHASFDCWLEDLEEKRKDYRSGACERRWNEAIAQLECSSSVDCGEEGRTDESLINAYDIYFGSDSAVISPPDEFLIRQIAQESRKAKTVKITGFTDRTGSALYNRQLAERRAAAVAEALKQAGAPSSVVIVEAKGELNPAVATDDEVKLGANRRTKIELFQ